MNQNLLKQYVSIVQKVAKIEQRRVPNHMVEYEELVSIGIIAVQAMIKNKTEEQLAKYNDAYMGTAVKWAIRNELRHRYKWYSLKHKTDKESDDDTDDVVSAGKVKEAVYETILSIDSLAASATDNDSPFDFIKDPSALPDEKAEIIELSQLIKQAIAKLPQKERTVVEYRFYRNMQAKDIAVQVGLSPSRITRIIQSALVSIREYLATRGRNDY
ncbi:MAG: sigma-70 family RNA polymerase sigma factor [Candidatus Gastranaerophilaceae bacterium]